MAPSRLSFVLLLLVTIGAGCHRLPPRPNDAYRDGRTSAEEWNRLFEGPEREVYRQRERIMRALAVRPGLDVVDVGAGTGAFTTLLSDAVGASGRVYAEEVMPKFSQFIAERAVRERRANVVSVVGTETGIGLPPGSVDVAFVCDVYHHFAQPLPVLASIWQALRPDGALFIVDFRRDPDRSPAWILEHARAGEEQVVREVEQSGFVSVARSDELRDNYMRRFRRVSAPVRAAP
jgi:predicted methyltransferase